METFELMTLVGGIMIGMGSLLFVLAAGVAFFLGDIDESEPR